MINKNIDTLLKSESKNGVITSSFAPYYTIPESVVLTNGSKTISGYDGYICNTINVSVMRISLQYYNPIRADIKPIELSLGLTVDKAIGRIQYIDIPLMDNKEDTMHIIDTMAQQLLDWSTYQISELCIDQDLLNRSSAKTFSSVIASYRDNIDRYIASIYITS